MHPPRFRLSVYAGSPALAASDKTVRRIRGRAGSTRCIGFFGSADPGLGFPRAASPQHAHSGSCRSGPAHGRGGHGYGKPVRSVGCRTGSPRRLSAKPRASGAYSSGVPRDPDLQVKRTHPRIEKTSDPLALTACPATGLERLFASPKVDDRVARLCVKNCCFNASMPER